MNEHINFVLDDVRNVPSVSLDEFQQSFLPQVVGSVQIDAISARLRTNGSLQPNRRWTLFPIDPCMETNENACFECLETIAAVIVEEAEALLNCGLNNRIQYDYIIDGETYRTVECLSSVRASSILSHATRVWSVRKLSDEMFPECALKAFWIPLDSRTEGKIQKGIFQRIEAKDPATRENPEFYKQYFMEIRACEVVIRTDRTEDIIPSLSHSYRLKYLYIASYVHRDISSGNILLCSGRGKISDLEYAKLFLPEGPKRDSNTGTPDFMATEVQEEQYLFKAKVDFNGTEFESKLLFSNTDTAPHQPFLHNFYHDVESPWWIGVHSLFITEPSTTERDQNARRKQKVHLNNLFPHCASWSPKRRNFLQAQASAYTDVTSCLPNEFQAVAAPLA
ncbi:hypothetical protein ARMSODRAFT_1010272 [Armillaria solidipes]|uniref:Fungal-type protein kinase domain-containing protein n=1 Tax=Armillaria solidipes TaxID=1076256 RepID=A0A2H3C3I4_9AGAR|nr:hypothetical protein ARMSODRAFT_1010272 [Armillaria solidipes]